MYLNYLPFQIIVFQNFVHVVDFQDTFLYFWVLKFFLFFLRNFREVQLRLCVEIILVF